jgi:hypothetical protein
MGRKNGYKISKLSGPLSPGACDIFRDFRNQTSSLMTLLFGQPGFSAAIAQSMAASRKALGATSY